MFTIVELFLDACAAVGVTFSVDSGYMKMYTVSDFLLKVGGDFASFSIGEIFLFQGLFDVWPLSSE